VTFLALNRNKRSITLNLKNDDSHEVVRKLVLSSDVFVESFQPGLTQSLGVGYETVSGINKDIVYCSISGYGQTGPYRDLVGHDINYISYGGTLGATGQESGPPVIPATQVSDIQAALYAAMAIVAALYRREKTGKGEYIDISLMDAAVASMIIPLTFHSAGVPVDRGTLLLSGGMPFYNVYETADHKFISIGALEPNFWAELCRALALEKYEDQQFASAVFEQIRVELAAAFRQKTRDEWVRLLNDREIPCAPVYDVDQVPGDPHVRSRGMILEMETAAFGKLSQLATPIRMTQNPLSVRLPPPKLGEHTLQILHGLGYSEKDVQRLKTAGAI
jgi:crotonobetainyl-CoA:carnitine CoA-transferase CaiB-like acyl-CoA transferase